MGISFGAQRIWQCHFSVILFKLFESDVLIVHAYAIETDFLLASASNNRHRIKQKYETRTLYFALENYSNARKMEKSYFSVPCNWIVA